MAHPEEARAVELFHERLDGVGSGSRAPDTAASWQSFQRLVHDADRGSPRGPGSPPDAGQAAGHGVQWRGTLGRGGRGDAFHQSLWRRTLVLSACAAAAAWVGVVYERSSHHAAPVTPARRTYATVAGERAELRLSDGTRVRLAPASRLSVSADYGTDRRDVYLDGEAYFDVVHDQRK